MNLLLWKESWGAGPLKGHDTCSDVHFVHINFIASFLDEQENVEDVQTIMGSGDTRN